LTCLANHTDPKWGNILFFQGEFERVVQLMHICKRCYNFYEAVKCANGMTYYYDFSDEIRGVLMKLQLISASVVAYTVLALALICYSGLSLPF
jgi:hypothetical protein